MAAKAKELRVELTAGVKGFQKGFKEAEGIAEGWGKNLGASFGMIATPAGLAASAVGLATAGIAAVGAAAVGAAAGLAMATKATLDYAGGINDIADRSGHTVSWLQEMRFAALQTGTDLETVGKGSTELRKALGEGSEDTERQIKALGLSMEALKNSSPDEQMSLVLSAIGKIEDPTKRTTLAIGLLGKAGELLVPLSRDVDDLRVKAQDLGVVMSDEALAAANKLGNELRSLSEAYDGTVRSIGGVIASNESTHQLVVGLASVFGSLTGSINENRDAMQSMVSDGVWLVAKGLEGIAWLAGEAEASVSGLVMIWHEATQALLGLTRVILEAKQFATLNLDDRQLIQRQIENVDRLAAAEKQAGKDSVQSHIDRGLAIEKTKNKLADLSKAIADSAGKKVSVKMGPEFIPGLDGLDGKAEEARRKKAAADADRLRAMEELYRTSGERMDAEADMEERARLGAERFEELKIEWIQERLDAERGYYDELDRLDALDENAARLRDEETARLKREQLESIVDALADLYDGLGEFSDAVGLGKFGEQLRGVVGWGEKLGGALEDGLLSWGEILGLAGSAISGIKSVFSTPKWQKLADGVGKRWGVTITEELAKQIEEDANRLGDNVAGMLKNLPAIIEEAGGIGAFGFDKATEAAHDLFSMIETGKLSVAEAGEAFDDVFGQLIPEAIDATTGLAKDSFLELIKLNERFGTKSAEVTKFLEGQNNALIKGLEAVAKGGKITEKSAAGVAASVVVAYKQLREQGLSARDALQQMAPSLDTLREKLQELGVGGGAAFDLLAEQSALYSDETAGPLLEAINGAGEALAALHNMNALTQESFSGLTASIGETYQALVESGQAGPAAMQAIAPDLQRVWELQQRTGYAVDATTQALLDEAVAAGVVGEAHVSAQDKMAQSAERLNEILEAMAKAMGIDIPAAAERAAKGVNDAFSTISAPDLTGTYAYTGAGIPTEPLPSFASGGIGHFGSGAMAMLHGDEWIVPEAKMERILSSGPSISLQTSVVVDPRQNYESQRRQASEVGRIVAERNSRQLALAFEMGNA